MLSSDSQRKTVVSASRKPMVSTVQSRRRVMQTVKDTSMLTRRKQIVIARPQQSEKKLPETKSPIRPIAQPRLEAKASTPVAQSDKVTAKELKESAIQKALASTHQSGHKNKKSTYRVHFGVKRVLLATVCAAVAVFAIVYFVNLNTPNISLKVAAMQSGIEASYPAYVPRDFSLSDIISENGKVTLSFKNSASGDAFTLIEEKSSWDSNALLNNYVSDEYGDNYTLIREQGLALYISGSDAAWVNGGVVYKIKVTSGSLTKKQIKAIAVSL